MLLGKAAAAAGARPGGAAGRPDPRGASGAAVMREAMTRPASGRRAPDHLNGAAGCSSAFRARDPDRRLRRSSRSAGRCCSRSSTTTCSRPPTWVGLANYRDARARPGRFATSIGHTLVYTALFVPISVGGALGVAVALNRTIRGIALLPHWRCSCRVVTSTVATGIIFIWLLDPTFGLVNYLLRQGRPAAARVLPGSRPGALLRSSR